MKIFLISCLVVLVTSNFYCTTEPEESKEDPELIVNNGSYSLINDLGESKEYTIEFDYQVIGVICYISGYTMAIEDSFVYSVVMDSPQKLIPGEKYSVTDSYYQSDYITTSPVILMNGFTYSSDINLNAVHTLKRKE